MLYNKHEGSFTLIIERLSFNSKVGKMTNTNLLSCFGATQGNSLCYTLFMTVGAP